MTCPVWSGRPRAFSARHGRRPRPTSGTMPCRVAQATLKDLRDHKRNEEADHFEAALDQAMARDCVVKVQWTGDADIDLMVKEPAGTVCSLRNQRTTSGGVLVGDLSSDDKAGIDGHMAVYCCPKAFSGNYQLLVRRVFGKLTTGKVSVEVTTHFNTKTAKTLREDDSPGQRRGLGQVRRGRWPSQGVHPRATGGQCRGGRGGPGEPGPPPGDPGPATRGGERPGRGGGPRRRSNRPPSAASAGQSQQISPFAFPAAWPNGLHGAVGYQPVIITLPEGANMVATAVVSADRRYVRITCQPFFSAVSNVHTFSMASASNIADQRHRHGRTGFRPTAVQRQRRRRRCRCGRPGARR